MRRFLVYGLLLWCGFCSVRIGYAQPSYGSADRWLAHWRQELERGHFEAVLDATRVGDWPASAQADPYRSSEIELLRALAQQQLGLLDSARAVLARVAHFRQQFCGIDSRDHALALFNLANTWLLAERPDSALSLLRQVLGASGLVSEDSTLAKVNNSLGVLYRDWEEPDSAAHYLLAARRHWQAADRPDARLLADFNLALLYGATDPAAGLRALHALGPLSVGLNALDGIHPLDIPLHLGVLHLKRGQLDSAEVYLRHLDSAAAGYETFPGQAVADLAWGELYLRRGDAERARWYFERVETGTLSADQRFRVLRGRGLCAVAAGQYSPAIQLFSQALGLAATQEPAAELEIMEQLGECYLAVDQAPAALYFWESAVAGWEKRNDGPRAALGRTRLLGALARAGYRDRALALLPGLAEDLMATDRPALWRMTYHNYFAEGLWRLGLDDRAERQYRRADSLWRAYGLQFSLPVAAATQLGLAQLFARQGRWEEAHGHAVAVLRMNESSARSGSTESRLRRRYQFAKAYDLAFRSRLEETPAAPYAAFAYAERSKATVLRRLTERYDLLGTGAVPDALVQREKQLGYRLFELQSRLIDELGADRTALIEARRQYETVLDTLRAYVPAAPADPFAADSVRAVQQRLTPDQSLLQMYLTEEKGWVMLLDRDTLRYVEIVGTDVLRPLISEYVQLISQPLTTPTRAYADDTDRYRGTHELSHRLYQLLLQPLAAHLRPELVLIPDDVLHYLPFETLLTALPERAVAFRTAPYLVHDYQFTYLPAATYFEPTPKSGPTELPILAFAPRYDGSDGLRPLYHNEDELAALANRYRGQFFLGEAATRNQLYQLEAQPGILHLSMHGAFDAVEPRLSYLAFQGQAGQNASGLVYAGEIYRRFPRFDLLFLSACQTARGEIHRGEGVLSLSRALFARGNRHLVNTLWNVDDQQVNQLIEHFYESLATDRRGSAAALVAAKRRYLAASDHARAHPYYWAGFIHYGTSTAVYPGARGIGYGWWFGLGVSLLVGAGWWRAISKKRH